MAFLPTDTGPLADPQLAPTGTVPTTSDWWIQNGLNYPQNPPPYLSNGQISAASGQSTAGAAPTAGGAPANGDWQGWFQQLTGGKPLDQAGLLALAPQLQAAGVQITPPSAAGIQSKIGIPDGNGGFNWIRVLNGDTSVASPTVWMPQGGSSSGSIGGALGADGGMADGSLLTPWTQQFTPRDPSQIAQDPAYQFQLAQGMKGIQNNAAAKGTLLTGGTLKALDQYGQGLASTYNDKYYNRDLGEYQMNQNTFFANQDRPFTKLSQLATLGKPQTLQPPTG